MNSDDRPNSLNNSRYSCGPDSMGVQFREDSLRLALTNVVWYDVLSTPHWHGSLTRGIVLSNFLKVHLMYIHFAWKRELLSNLYRDFINNYIFLIFVKQNFSGLFLELLDLLLHLVFNNTFLLNRSR